jgi:hypothetical protein
MPALTLDIPIRYALETAHGAAVDKAPQMLTEVEVENLSVGNRHSFTAGTGLKDPTARNRMVLANATTPGP